MAVFFFGEASVPPKNFAAGVFSFTCFLLNRYWKKNASNLGVLKRKPHSWPMKNKIFFALSVCFLILSSLVGATEKYREISGVYPHLVFSNSGGECGTGAVVAFAGKLWAVTYPPHVYFESDDKLYEISPNLDIRVRPESVGGTNANRFIHRESGKLVIGPYVISPDASVRAIPRRLMPGRLTGTARHLADPANRVYIATMEEGLYELDLNTMQVGWLIRDGNLKPDFEVPQNLRSSLLPRPPEAPAEAEKSKLFGYHGKGLYSGQGRLFYSNNGIVHPKVASDPTLKSGALAYWKGYADRDWTAITEKQFTEITSAGGIEGSPEDASPLWALGWDYRSVILALIEGGKCAYFRLPKGSHSYDGSHGWNTEWPRIRNIGKDSALLATMHGTFWNFPPSFSLSDRKGISPRSNYLKVIGDFCLWNGKVVFGCDDTAKKEFLNKRKIKSEGLSPFVSNSNLWFVEDSQLDNLGRVLGEGSVWLNDAVKKGDFSDPYLFSGYDKKALYLVNSSDTPMRVSVEVDKDGNGVWTEVPGDILVEANSSKTVFFGGESKLKEALCMDISGEWIRLRALDANSKFSAHFSYSNFDTRTAEASEIFAPLAKSGGQISAHMLSCGTVGDPKLGLLFFSGRGDSRKELGYYELDKNLNLSPAKEGKAAAILRKTAPAERAIKFTDRGAEFEDGSEKILLPINPNYDSSALDCPRFAREVATERDILMAGGIIYELPAINAGGAVKMRAVSAADFAISDFCSYAGLMFLSGVLPEAVKSDSSRIIKSSDSRVAVWAGVIDDLWKLGKPRGEGYAVKNADMRAGEISDRFFSRGFDKKRIELSAEGEGRVAIEADVDGSGLWILRSVENFEGGKTVVLDARENPYMIRLRALSALKNFSAKMVFE